ncbi:retropepsin-like aspartic protease family protein [Sulfuriflexus mobilis]|uniref:retropepsin-like aspartic protease family protein n=1 Tax=Sulfuriflexus mobilis TaxID=1811807 RepID=UPI000F83E01B|nr:retropepsin-like aspartic protease [Sulfuriflexus mobilis]
MRFLSLFLFAVLPPLLHAESTQSIPIYKYEASTYYIDVSIADSESEAYLIDTGASYVTISETTLADLLDKDQAEFVRVMSAVLADGRGMDVPVYRVSSLQIGKHCHFSDVEVAVIPGEARCVLGLSALRQAAPFIFSIDPPELTVSNCTAA